MIFALTINANNNHLGEIETNEKIKLLEKV